MLARTSDEAMAYALLIATLRVGVGCEVVHILTWLYAQGLGACRPCHVPPSRPPLTVYVVVLSGHMETVSVISSMLSTTERCSLSTNNPCGT